MNLAQPGWLAGLLVVLALAVVVILAGRRHRQRLRSVFHPAWLDRIVPARVVRRRRLRGGASLVGLAACFVALAEPRSDKQLLRVDARGTDLVLAVDLSLSMTARDVEPSRLDRARREVSDLLGQLEADRVGLVVFAGGAYPRLPLTADLRAVAIVLEEMAPDQFTAQGSDLGGAIREGLRLLARNELPAGKAIIVFSDGEVHEPEGAMRAAQEAADARVPVYAVGIGLESAPVPVGEGFLEWQGQSVTTTPDPEMLKAVARLTGGAYVSSVASGADMTSLVAELRRSLASVVREQHQRETWNSLFQWPLGVATGLLLCAAWLGDGRRLAGLVVALALGAGALRAGPAEAGARADADAAYREGEYREAARQLEELSLASPGDPDLLERLAAARYRLGDYDAAARAWDMAARLRDGAPDDLFNAANSHYQAGRLERALALYDEVLAARPDDGEAQANRDLVEQELVERRKVKPPPPPTGGGGEEEEKNPGEGEEQPAPGEAGEPEEGPGEAEPRPGEGSDEPSGGPEEGEGADPVPGDAPPTAGGSGELGEETGPISAAQAERLLDAVEEGKPSYTYSGPPGGPPW